MPNGVELEARHLDDPSLQLLFQILVVAPRQHSGKPTSNHSWQLHLPSQFCCSTFLHKLMAYIFIVFTMWPETVQTLTSNHLNVSKFKLTAGVFGQSTSECIGRVLLYVFFFFFPFLFFLGIILHNNRYKSLVVDNK